jgi:Uma2 family endonuclease
LPGGRIPTEAAPLMAPDLTIEVPSESNTKGEMALKRREYFSAGVRLVWLIDHRTRTATIFTDVNTSHVLDETASIDGAPVLPGFTLSLRELFAEFQP